MSAKKKTAKKTTAKKTSSEKAEPKDVTKKATSTKAAAKKSPAKKAVAKKRAPQLARKMEEEIEHKGEKSTPIPPAPKKMSAFVKKQREKLLQLRDDLMEALYGIHNEAVKAASTGSDNGSGQHQGDAGSDSYDRDLALSMLEKEKDSLLEVDKALERIEKGTYGICEVSGENIPQARLEVLPFARLTIACQQALEAERLTRGPAQGDYGFGAFGEGGRSVSLDGSND
jgi:RNA polymerase-binding transcription factor DksA